MAVIDKMIYYLHRQFVIKQGGIYMANSYTKKFGDKLVHYDSNGNLSGYSTPKFDGSGYIHHDMEGHLTGESTEKAFGGGYIHSDLDGHITGHSTESIWGGYNNYDEDDDFIDHANMDYEY